MNSQEIVNNYNKNIKTYDNFKIKIEILLKELLQDNVNYHDITSRIKTKDSLENKLLTKENKYSTINEVTDVIGCRIISYFEDDVEEIVQIVENEFNIDKKNSINKKEILESNKFGYLSYHIVCSINDTRLKLPEYKKYKDIKFEIQIRTILQHAWAEIEHDIGYKSRSEIPTKIRRKFSRIAGLLETADENFCDIKKELKTYNNQIQEDSDKLLDTDLNLDSLYLYTKSSDLLAEMDHLISKIDADSIEEKIIKSDLSASLSRLLYFNIKTIKELDTIIHNNKSNLLKFSKNYIDSIDGTGEGSFLKGITYFYLSYFLIAEKTNFKAIVDYLKYFIEDDGDGKIEELAKNIEVSFNTINS